ncbi:MAG: sulfate permease [Gammaproteobacteria bacterium]|nr:sulfate permease [Gammaproteobacteria bacterium]
MSFFRVKNWPSYVPIVEVARDYRHEDFGHDVVAGIVVGVVTVPQAIAYAFLAGLPAQAGLYACLVPMVIYAVFGSSRQLVVGPVAIAALMVAATIAEYAPAYSNHYIGISTILCLQVGCFLWLLRVFQMGGIVNLLSHPVITGFVNAAAFLIIISQIPAFTGITVNGPSDPFEKVIELIFAIESFNPVALIIGIGSFLVLWVVRRYGALVIPGATRDHPISRVGPMLIAIISTVLVATLGLDIDTVGYVPAGLPDLTIPPFDPALWLDLAPASAMIALVAYVESYTIGTTLAARQRKRVNSHQELIALGAANLGAAFTGAYPVAGSFSRSSVNYAAGARTPVSSLVCACVIVITLLWLTPLFEYLPHAALGAIIMISVGGLINFRSIREHWYFYHQDVYTHFITFGAVLFFGVEVGLIAGVAISVVMFVRRSSSPNIAVVGRLGSSAHFRNVERHQVETFAHVTAIRVDENLYFANANQVENRILKILERHAETKQVVLVCSAINFIDTSGLEMLHRINHNLDKVGIKLHLSDVKGPVMDQLESAKFPLELSGKIFLTTDQAMRDLDGS